MLDKIQNNSADLINQSQQSQNLDRISQIGATNPFYEVKGKYFIDESDISELALQKYEHEQDIKRFSQILSDMDEKEARDMVIKKVFNGTIELDSDDLLIELSKNVELLNDVNN